MPRGLKEKTGAKGKQYRAPCSCTCGSTNPATIAAHGKVVAKRANINSLAIARSVTRLTSSSTSCLAPAEHRSHKKPSHPVPPTEDNITEDYVDEDQFDEDPMEVDQLQASGSSNRSPPLTHVWASRTSRRECEDEDLVAEPGSPEPLEDEDETGNDENQDPDDPEFLSDNDELPVHAEISATEQLTTSFQVRATKAGMLLTTVINC